MKAAHILILALWLPSLVIGQNVANLHFKTVDENPFDLKGTLSKGPALLVFWATWCKPCQNELPALKETFEKYQNQGLSLLAISLDSPRSLSKVKSFVKRSQLPYTFLLDPDGTESGKVFVKDIPYLLLVNSAGEVAYSHRGYRIGDEKEVAAQVAKLFASPADPVKNSGAR